MELPQLRLNTEIAKANIQRMVSKARKQRIEVRPHFKTHQSVAIGSWFSELGVTGITVSSLKMAEHFAANGWDDITIAFPLSILDIERINILAEKIDLKILLVDLSTIPYLEQKLSSTLSVYIEIDPKYGRSGIEINNSDLVDKMINEILGSSRLKFVGFYAHAGHTYKCSSKSEVEKLVKPIIEQLLSLKKHFGGKICWGDTPSCSILDEFGGIDQLSPGNFVFYDWMQFQIGSCSIDDIAVEMLSPVVAKFYDRKELLIHGGAVHFSKDFLVDEYGNKNFGQVVNPKHKNDYSNYLASVSQEHGIVKCSEAFFNSINTGDLINIYPIHSCLTANLMQAYITESNEVIGQFASGAPFRG